MVPIAGDDIEAIGLLPEEETASFNSDNLPSFLGKSDEFWKSFIDSSLPNDKVMVQDNNYIPQQKQISELERDGTESKENPNSKAKSSKSVKRNKWKPEEVKKLIKMRGELHSRFQVVKGRMAVWEEISNTLLAYGINRSPGQCKSLWTSLVQKYEVCCPSLCSVFLVYASRWPCWSTP